MLLCIQNKHHTRLHPLVPAPGNLVLSACGSCKDVLLHSMPITWLDFIAGQFQLEGLLILRLAFRHRLFLKWVIEDEPCSGQEIFRRDGAVGHFHPSAGVNECQTCQLYRIARVTHAFCNYLTLTRRRANVTRNLTFGLST